MSLIIGIFLWVVACRACASTAPRIVVIWSVLAGAGIPLISLLDSGTVTDSCIGAVFGIPVALAHLYAVSKADGILKWVVVLVLGTIAYFSAINLVPELVHHHGNARTTAAA